MKRSAIFNLLLLIIAQLAASLQDRSQFAAAMLGTPVIKTFSNIPEQGLLSNPHGQTIIYERNRNPWRTWVCESDCEAAGITTVEECAAAVATGVSSGVINWFRGDSCHNPSLPGPDAATADTITFGVILKDHGAGISQCYCAPLGYTVMDTLNDNDPSNHYYLGHHSYCDTGSWEGHMYSCFVGKVSTTLAPSTATATGDPHLQNIHGQRFDLMRPGHVELINIPRGGPVDSALFAVQADARRLGGHCADLYFQTVNVTGAWADEVRAGGMTFTAGEARDETPQIAGWTSFGPLKLKVARGHTSQGIKYLNVYVKNLGLTEAAVGGLLGEDDFVEATKPDIMCKKSVSLTKTAPSRSDAMYASEAIADLSLPAPA